MPETRNKICTKAYLLPSGDKCRSASPEAVAILYEFSNKETRTLEPSKFPDTIQHCAMLNGFSQKTSDKYAGKTVEEAVDLFDSMVDFLMDGQWISSVEGAGTRPTLLAEAIANLLPEKYPNAASAKAMLDALKPTEDMDDATCEKLNAKRKGIEANADIKAEVERIKAVRAAEKAKSAAESAPLADNAINLDSV